MRVGEHLDLTGAVLELEALEHVARCGPCRVAALEARLFPAGCEAPALGHALLAHLDDELPDALAEHARRCAACAAELQDARRALDELAAEPLEVAAPGPAPRVAVSCTYCHGGLDRPEAVYCAACLAPHHDGCFADHGRCSAPGCAETQVVRPGAVRVVATPRRPRALFPRVAFLAVALGGVGAAALAGQRLLSRATPGPAAPAPASKVERLDPRDAVVATLDGEPIRRRALLHRCALDPTWRALPPGRSTERLRVELQHLEAEVDRRLLLREAKRLELRAEELHRSGEAGIARDARNQLERLPADARAALQEAGVAVADHVRFWTDQYLAEAARERLAVDEEVVPTADAVHRFYREHLADFRSGGVTRFREVVLYPAPGDAARARAGPGEARDAPAALPLAARTRALAARLAPVARLAPGYVDFAAVARDLSEDHDPGREQLLETAALSQVLSPPLAGALERMAPGQVLGPIPCVTGCVHALQLLQRTPAVERPLEEVEQEVRRRVRAEQVERLRVERLRGMRAAARVEAPWWVAGDGQ